MHADGLPTIAVVGYSHKPTAREPFLLFLFPFSLFSMPATVYFFEQSALSLIADQDSKRHAHRALQLCVGLAGGFEIERDGWESVSQALLAPDQPHRVRTREGPVACLFLDPGPRHYQHWLDAGGLPQAASAALIAGLQHLWRQPDAALARRLAAEWSAAALPGLAHAAAPIDARMQRALQQIEADASLALNHRDLAALAHLSTSRFAERFRAETGMPVRNYLLWRRLLRALKALQTGASVTDAALDAGFADTAHLSRSFRRVLGAAPSELRHGHGGA